MSAEYDDAMSTTSTRTSSQMEFGSIYVGYPLNIDPSLLPGIEAASVTNSYYGSELALDIENYQQTPTYPENTAFTVEQQGTRAIQHRDPPQRPSITSQNQTQTQHLSQVEQKTVPFPMPQHIPPSPSRTPSFVRNQTQAQTEAQTQTINRPNQISSMNVQNNIQQHDLASENGYKNDYNSKSERGLVPPLVQSQQQFQRQQMQTQLGQGQNLLTPRASMLNPALSVTNLNQHLLHMRIARLKRICSQRKDRLDGLRTQVHDLVQKTSDFVNNRNNNNQNQNQNQNNFSIIAITPPLDSPLGRVEFIRQRRNVLQSISDEINIISNRYLENLSELLKLENELALSST